MSQRALETWLFGKMPALGDFVSRGLDQSMRERLDTWLTREMEMARAGAGDDFDRRFDAAPAWNYVDQDADGRWIGGALCASRDRSGRRFPLIMGATADDARMAAARSAGCLSAMCRAFVEGWDADGLALAEVTPEDTGWQPTGSEWALLASAGPELVIPGRFPQGAITVMVEMAQ